MTLARRDQWRRDKLHDAILRFRDGAAARGLPLLPSESAIQPMPCGDDARAVALARALEARGCWVAAIRPPTVPEGGARLRITLGAAHADADIDGLLDALLLATDAVDAGTAARDIPLASA